MRAPAAFSVSRAVDLRLQKGSQDVGYSLLWLFRCRGYMCEAVMDQTHAVHGHARGHGVHRCGCLPTALRRTGPGCNNGRCAFVFESPCMTCRSSVSWTCHPLFAGPATVQHMTAFATHPGASSRESISAAVRNGFFTGALKNKLRSQGKTTDVRRLLGCVRDDVLEATGGRQQPYTAGSLHGDLCLVVPSDEVGPVRPACVVC